MHIIAVMGWMAGLLMLPRFLAYQLEAEPDGELFEKMRIASQKLKTIILRPAMILSILFGVGLIAIQWPDIMRLGWFHAKMLLIIPIIAYHEYMSILAVRIARGARPLRPKTLRMLNEIPFLIAIIIVIVVVVEPF